MPGRRPNVLFVITDQQRADHVGFGGNDIVRTPHLDALAARGTVFDRAYVTNPICMPNRCSILTGRVPSAHGVIFNDRSLAWTTNTFVRMLRGVGYQTALIGKSHIQHGMSRDIRDESELEPALGDPYPEGWDTWEHPDPYRDGPVDVPKDFYGFDHVEFSIGHGDLVAGHHLRWALEKGGDPEVLLDPRLADKPARTRYEGWWQVYQPLIDEELYSTSFVAERSVAWLEQAATRDEPWVLQCSFPDPHHPFTPPGRWWEAYDPKEMPVSQSFDDPLDQAPEHLRLIRSFGPGPNPVQFFGPTRDMVQHALAAEFGMLEMIDDAVGSVFGALERLGMADDTIVVFTSDHGDMFGDHGLMLKGTMQYQGCLRVPLVIARPGGAPARSSSLAASMDLAQTLLELCGVTPFDNMQGHSLVPILDDPAASVRDYVLIEEDFPPAARMRRFPSHIRTVIGEAGRITRYATGELEVFDLEADPAELVNLANRPEGRERRAQLGELLAEALVDHSDLARSAPLTTSAAVAR